MSITSTPSVSAQSAEPGQAAHPTHPVAISELKRAWTAVQAGEFRQPHSRAASPDTGTSTGGSTTVEPYDDEPADEHHQPDGVHDLTEALRGRRASSDPSSRWLPAAGERVVPVVASAGSVGCSTIAVALATAAASRSADGTSRVVECSSAHTSGLAAASTAELGRHESGWVQGTREAVLLERTGEVLLSLDDVATPAPLDDPQRGGTGTARRGPPNRLTGADVLTVIDTGWDVEQLAATGSWVGHLTRTAPVVIVVARPTIPGLRRLEAALELLEHGFDRGTAAPATLVAVIGRRRKWWAKGVEHSAGPRTRAALREQRVHEIPEDRQLAVTGLNSTPLPPALVAAADQLLREALSARHGAQLGAPLVGRPHDVDDLRQLPGASPANEEATSNTTHHLVVEPHPGIGSNPEGTTP